jgi:hypothetical protein
MRYTIERQREINKKLNGLKRRILITNMKSEAHKLLKNDGKINDDYKDFNDLKDDEFKRKALFNEYARKIIGNYGNISELEERLSIEGNDLINYFLNNYPRVMHEIRMYSAPTVDNLYNVIRKLYNREIQELDMLDDKTANEDNAKSVISMLKKISNNLKDLRKFANTEKERNELLDMQQKYEAVMTVLENVDNGVEFMGRLLNMKYADVHKTLDKDVKQTTIPSSPNEPLPVLEQYFSSPVLSGAFRMGSLFLSMKKEKEKEEGDEKYHDAIETPQAAAAPAPEPLPQTPRIKKMEKKEDVDIEDIDIDDENLKKQQFIPTTDIMDNDILNEAKVYGDLDYVTKKEYADYIGEVLGETSKSVNLRGGNKKALYKYFKDNLEVKREEIRRIEAENKRKEAFKKKNEEMKQAEEKRYSDIRERNNMNLLQIQDLENEIRYLTNMDKIVHEKVVGVKEARELYNNNFIQRYSLPEDKSIGNIRKTVRAILKERSALLNSLKNNI